MPCWRSVRLFCPWQRLLRGRLYRQSHRFWARLVWSSCGGTAGRDVSVSSYPHLPRHLISLLGSCPCPPSTRNANAKNKKGMLSSATPMATPTGTVELGVGKAMFNPLTWVRTLHLGKVILPDRHMCRRSTGEEPWSTPRQWATMSTKLGEEVL